MTHPKRPAHLAALALAAALPLAAGAAEASPDSGRYAFVPVREGALRLDRETGAVVFCSGAAGSRSCVPIAVAADVKNPQPPEQITPRSGALRSGAMERLSMLADEAVRRLAARMAELRRSWVARSS